jgi:Na+-driven multidrug efflux pump
MQQPVSHATILRIAIPIMLSHVTEPMIGVVNTAVVGQLPGAHLIGGVVVGSFIFSFLFLGFGCELCNALARDSEAGVCWKSLIRPSATFSRLK